MKHLLLINLLFASIICSATTYQVGSSKTYVSPKALYDANVVQDGDVIEIDAETYTGNACLAVWKANDLIIKGVGGKAKLVADGKYIWGKGIWVCAGNNITVENIEFSGATVPDKNGAGIRLDGIGLTVRYCYFHHNENGILTNNSNEGDILIEYSEFDNNGYGDGYTHNLYIGHVHKLTFQYNNTHHARIGHNLKSRASENYILYNRIMDEATGTSSRLIDLPNGGFSVLMGNLLMQGNNAPNNNLVGYGLEGLSNPVNELYFINNTLVNKRTASCIFVAVKSGTTIANISNNIFAGTGTLVQGTTTAMSNNIKESTIANLNFVDEANYDYHLLSNSPAIDAGMNVSSVNDFSLTPISVYENPTNFRPRTSYATIDVGAYEFASTTSIAEIAASNIVLYPNPFVDRITIKNVHLKKSEISILNLLGQNFTPLVRINVENNTTHIYTPNLPKGIYLIQTQSFAKIIYKQ